MPKTSRLLILLIPGAIFLLVLAMFISKIPKKESATTESNPTPIVSSAPSLAPKNLTPLQTYITNVTNLQIEDPQLTPPNYDRKIFLPDEK